MVLNDSLLMVILQHDSGHILEKQDMCALWLKGNISVSLG